MKTLAKRNTAQVALVSAIFLCIVLGIGLAGCGKKDSSDNEETAQQVGDAMASIDEGGGSSSGAIALNEEVAAKRTYARLAPGEGRVEWILDALEKKAEAATCLSTILTQFSACTSHVITRTFGGCTIGGATLSGTVTLTWAGGGIGACAVGAAGDTITRAPNWTLTGRRGATLTASVPTGKTGQTLTRGATAATFTFTNDGVRRAFTDTSGTTTIDFTTTVTSAITITGATRASRTLSGGAVHVLNNLTGVSCDYVPSSVTWTSTCNCASSGSWTVSCSDNNTGSLTLTGCGTGTIKIGSASQDVTFDRCYGT